jgi:hypothetical protein
MPLVYDDIPGSWGTYSEGWPSTSEWAVSKWVFANKSKIIPYGSYVLMESSTANPYLRVETQELLDKLNENFNIVLRSIVEEQNKGN